MSAARVVDSKPQSPIPNPETRNHKPQSPNPRCQMLRGQQSGRRCNLPSRSETTRFGNPSADSLGLLFFFSLLLSSLELSDTKVYAPQIRALLGIAAHVCTVVLVWLSVRKLTCLMCRADLLTLERERSRCQRADGAMHHQDRKL